MDRLRRQREEAKSKPLLAKRFGQVDDGNKDGDNRHIKAAKRELVAYDPQMDITTCSEITIRSSHQDARSEQQEKDDRQPNAENESSPGICAKLFI